MFSQTVEYALRAVVYLAQHAREPAPTEAVATATQVPPAYLAKVLQGLVKAGIVRSQRGVGGGVMLAQLPEELTVLEVINAVEPLQRIHTCPLGIATHGTQLCPLHKRLDEAMEMVETTFCGTTIAEILNEPSHSQPLCAFPPLHQLGRTRPRPVS